jgi:hypothetical protein
MLIVWGKKVVRRRLGRVAAFCAVCRGMSCFKAVSLRTVPHLYFIPMGRGELTIHELTCEDCGGLFGSKEAPYAAFSQSRTTDVVELAMETTPDLVERCGERMAMEERLDSLTPAERSGLIAEPFIALNYWMHRKAGPGLISTGTGFAIIGLVFLMPAAIAAWASGAPAELRFILTGMVALLTVCTIVGLRRGPVAWIPKTAHPLLVRALRPLAPTEHELAMALDALRREKLIIAKRIDPRALAADLQAA